MYTRLLLVAASHQVAAEAQAYEKPDSIAMTVLQPKGAI
jgi:hypothetical protein